MEAAIAAAAAADAAGVAAAPPIGPSLSEQQLIDCVHTDSTRGCLGGLPQEALLWAASSPAGMAPAAAYPYLMSGWLDPGDGTDGGACRNGTGAGTGAAAAGMGPTQQGQQQEQAPVRVAPAAVAAVWPPGSEEALKEAVRRQPVVVAIHAIAPLRSSAEGEATSSGGGSAGMVNPLRWYQRGVFTGPCSSDPRDADHAVLLVGYGTTATAEAGGKGGGGTDYWVVRNSFGLSWGPDGGWVRARVGGSAT